MGFEMEQGTSGAHPVCLFVVQMNFGNDVPFSYLYLLKDSLCCEYHCFYDPSVSPMYVFVSNVGLQLWLCILHLCATASM